MNAWVLRAISAMLLGQGLLSCGASPQDVVEIPLVAFGRDASSWETNEEMTLSLTRADVAFGPLYVCAGVQAGANCDTARLEWRESAVVDALSEEPQQLGILEGVSGTVRSWMFDYGITSLLTENAPKILSAAHELGGVSLVLEGKAVLSGTEVPFSVEVVVQQEDTAERGVPVVRKSSSDVFSGEVTVDTEVLEVRFDPTVWAAALRRSYFEERAANCEVGADETCSPVEFEPSSRAAQVIRHAMTSGSRPLFILK
jgi:hypothetical protein